MADATDKKGNPPRVVGFYGRSGSGKTTLVERVLRALRERGLRAAVIKQSCHVPEMDTPGKDTWRFAQAGANPVAFYAEGGGVLFLSEDLEVHDLVALMAAMGQNRPDIILVEGARDEDITKVRVGDIETRPNTVMDYTGDFDALMDFIQEGVTK